MPTRVCVGIYKCDDASFANVDISNNIINQFLMRRYPSQVHIVIDSMPSSCSRYSLDTILVERCEYIRVYKVVKKEIAGWITGSTMKHRSELVHTLQVIKFDGTLDTYARDIANDLSLEVMRATDTLLSREGELRIARRDNAALLKSNSELYNANLQLKRDVESAKTAISDYKQKYIDERTNKMVIESAREELEEQLEEVQNTNKILSAKLTRVVAEFGSEVGYERVLDNLNLPLEFSL